VRRKQQWNFLALLVSVCYPFVVHYLVVTEQYLFAGIYIIVMMLLIGIQKILYGNRSLAIGLIFFAVIVSCLLYYQTRLIIFIPPVIIPLALAIIFGRTLIGDQTAFITIISQKMISRPLFEEEKKYTRFITYLWVSFFLFLVVESIMVAFTYSIETWSYVTNFLNYILVVVFSLSEYVLRRVILHHIEHPSFIGFIKQLIHVQFNR